MYRKKVIKRRLSKLWFSFILSFLCSFLSSLCLQLLFPLPSYLLSIFHSSSSRPSDHPFSIHFFPPFNHFISFPYLYSAFSPAVPFLPSIQKTSLRSRIAASQTFSTSAYDECRHSETAIVSRELDLGICVNSFNVTKRN